MEWVVKKETKDLKQEKVKTATDLFIEPKLNSYLNHIHIIFIKFKKNGVVILQILGILKLS